MKQISRALIAKKVKTEYKIARKWRATDWGRTYVMMIDLEDGEIWCDCFLDCNAWKEYVSDAIEQLDYTPGYVKETEQGYIDDAISKLRRAGWSIID